MKGNQGRVLGLCVVAILGITSAPARPKDIHVTIHDLRFAPEKIKAEVGDTVEWINEDILAHTATARGRWDVMIPVNGSGRVVLRRAGQVAYYCRFHPNMTADITIAANNRK